MLMVAGVPAIGPSIVGGAAVGAAGGYAANRFLGYLMTSPEALTYTLRAARALAAPVATTATHTQ